MVISVSDFSVLSSNQCNSVVMGLVLPGVVIWLGVRYLLLSYLR